MKRQVYFIIGVLIAAVIIPFILKAEPAQNASVYIEWTDGKHNYTKSTIADLSGYYEFSLPVGEANVSAEFYKKFGNEYICVKNATGKFAVNGIEWKNITLPNFPKDEVLIKGYVYDNKTGLPIANENVSIIFHNDYFDGFNFTYTDSNGYYEIHAPASNISIVVNANGYYYTGKCVGTVEEGETRTVDLYIEPLVGIVKGFVRDVDTSEPIQNARIIISGVNTSYSNVTYSDEFGYYEFKVIEGNFSIMVVAQDYFMKNTNEFHVGEEIKWLNITMRAFPPDNAWVDGFVHDKEGNPIANANVSVSGSITTGSLFGTFVRETQTNETGYYIVSVPSYPPTHGFSFITSAKAEKEGYFENSTYLYSLIAPGVTKHVDITLVQKPPENCIVKGYIYIKTAPPTKKIHYVGGTGAGNYTTIQEAINAASNGDIIKVYPGTYDGPIIINKEVKLIGDPAIDGHGDYGIYIQASNVSVENFTIYNCSTGIYVRNDSQPLQNITIRNSTVYSNSVNGIELYCSNSLVEFNHIYNNQNGVVLREEAINVVVTNNNIYENNVCGIYLIGNDNRIESNSISDGGYGIYILAENCEIINNTIKNSTHCELYIKGSNNAFINNTVGVTKFSFTYEGNVSIKNASLPAAEPSHWQSIGKFLEISKIDTSPAWMNIRIYYDDSDVVGLYEFTLKIWKWNGSWQEDGWNGSRYLDMAKNVVGVNITTFSIFAPLALAPNHLPYATNETPANGSIDVSINPTLSVVVHDEDGDVMNVSFYDASSDTLIGYVDGVLPGNTASIVWSGLDYETTYYWYVIINDSYGENKSETWHFTTVPKPSVVYVDDDYNEATPGWGDTKFNKIQNAINAVIEGGVVYVYEGIYKENIVINKKIDVVGENKDTVIIEGDETGDVVNISVNHVNVSGFTIRNSSLEPIEPFPAGIKVYHASNVKISDCLLLDNYAGILLLNTSNVIVTSNIVRDNEVDVFLQNSDKNIISENDCSNSNEGIWLDNSHNNSISNNNCSDNDVGIAIDYSNNNTISHCILDNLDGINIFHSNNNTISYCTISNNLIGIKIETNSANNSILYSTISNNNAGIRIYNSENVSVYYCNIINNLNGTVITGSRYCEIHYNNIYGNKYYGMQNTLSDTTYLVEATRNYWGSADGPYHLTQNPDGKGDNITDNILFIPWFSSPIKIAIEKSIHAGMNDIEVVNETDVHLSIETIKENVLRVVSFEGAPVEEYSASIGKYVEIDVENETAIEWPIFIKLYYTQEDLNNAGLSENEIVGIYFYNESAKEWQLFNDTGVNTADVVINGIEYEGYAWANAWHLTIITAGSEVKPNAVYVNDDWVGLPNGTIVDGHEIGYDAFASIQDGINGVASGGIVYVYEGVYEESIGINKKVSIISLNGTANTIIKASGQNAVTMNYPCLLDGFTIRDAHADYDNVRGIWVKADGCIIRNVTITNISAKQNDSITIYTYGIMINKVSSCAIENVTIYDIEGNDSTAYGIYAYESNNNSFKDITIFNITSVDIAYGIYISHSKNGELFSIDISNVNGSNSYGIRAYPADNYILRWINVTASRYGIVLEPGSDYNVIENCIASNNTYYGIAISGATHNIIRNNSVYDNANGMTLWMNCYNNTIKNNTISNNSGYGIYFFSGDMFNIIKENVIYDNQYGIYLNNLAGNNTILSNYIYNNGDDGMRIYSSYNNISFNHVYNNSKYGILISSGENNTVYANYIHDNEWDGVHISDHSSNNTILSNYIYNNSYDGIKLYYYTSYNLIKNNHIYNNSNGVRINYKNHTNNVIQSNHIFGNKGNGISIYQAQTINNTVSFNQIYNNSYGIYIKSSGNNTISHCNISYNRLGGIYLEFADYNIIEYNIIMKNNGTNVYATKHGIFLRNSKHNKIIGNEIKSNKDTGILLYILCHYNQIHNNTIYSNEVYGILVYGSSDPQNWCKYNRIENNTIFNNGWSGIATGYEDGLGGIDGLDIIHNKIYGNGHHGIFLHAYSYNVTIRECEIYNNSDKGIFAISAENNTIYSNKIYSNQYGIYLSSSSNNLIYNNYFNNTINAYDEGNNIWNISKTAGINILGGAWLGGNYWHDYAGNDTDGDDLGDTMLPYNCSGNIANGGDWHPLLVPTNHPPAVPYNPTPSDGATDVELDITLQWQCYDPDGDALSYDIYFGFSSSSLEKKAGNITSASYPISNLQYSTTYYWRVVAWDEYGAKSVGPVWSFTTKEDTPPTVSNPHPANGSTGIAINPVLAIDVDDVDGDMLTVTFYDASDDSVIGMVENASPGSTVSIVWQGLQYSTTYSWYVIVSDGIKSTKSPTWTFTTKAKPQYTLTVSVNPANAGIVSMNPAGGVYEEGTIVTLTAIANEGYVFAYWSGDASGTNPTIQIIMNSNKNIIANFEAITPNHPPNVEITFPFNGTVVSGVITIQGKAWDEDGNDTLQKVEIRIDEGEWKVASGTTSWSYKLNTTKLKDGIHIVEARSCDGIDYSSIAKIEIIVSNIVNHPPEIEILSPENGSTVKGSIVIKGKAWDEDGNESLIKVEIRIDGKEWINATGTISWAYTLDTTKLSNGWHIIEARSYDGIDYSSIASIKINVQNEKEEKGLPLLIIGIIIVVIAVIAVAVLYLRKK